MSGRLLWPIACLITLIGYFGAWVDHPVAGLVVTGLDLGEYVKFLPSTSNGTITLWRQGFYLPLLTVAVTCSLLAYRDRYRYPFVLRLGLIILGIIATLNILPPAWSPMVLRSDEFRLQTFAIIGSIGLLAMSPLLGRLPGLPVYLALTALAIASLWFPASGFLRVLPDIEYLYNSGITPGWGLYILGSGLLTLVVAYWLGYKTEKQAIDEDAPP